MVIRKHRNLVALASVFYLFAPCSLPGANARLPQESAQDLSRQAYAVLRQNCFGCHGAAKMSGLDLRTAESVLAGGDNGKVIEPSDASASGLYQFITHQSKPAMPPGKKLPDGAIETLRRWIEAGASFDGFEKDAATGKDDGTAKLIERPITPEERDFWAFRPPRRSPRPSVSHPGWGANPIDAFLLAKMKAKGLKPSPRADRPTLIRRAYLDLTGLPPAPEEVEAFVKDSSPGAWERVIDRLLASPHYGERWARHWLDLVRYADSGGFEFDVDRPDAWRYRDYVVKAFNEDKPYDRFIREQLAGDEYAPDSQEAMIATGFLRLGPEGGGGGERGRQDALDDLITTTSLTFMGLTVGCARCHDHKFDPIPQKDFYRIQAIFAPSRPISYPLVGSDVVAAHKAETQRIEGLQRPLKKTKDELEAPYLKALVDEAVSRLPEYMQIAWRTPPEKRTPGQRLNVQQIKKTLEDDTLSQKLTEKDIVARMSADDKRRHQELVEQIKALDRQKPKPYPTARAIGESGSKPGPTYFLHRGAPDAKGPVVTPGALSVINETDYEFPAPPPDAKSSYRRRGLAEWLVSKQNPLTARVMVNRIWQHHFGEGIVRTPSNFGKLGEPPTNPELLDWLSVEFMDGATGRRGDGAKDNSQSATRDPQSQVWSVKRMHRLIMTSQAYQMASDDIAANVAIDPENRLLWRMPRVRLEAEIIRDQILAVAGNLDRSLGGPCVYPYIDPKLFQSSTKRTWPGKPDEDPSTWRRSLYVYSKRSIRYPLFETFDQPNLVNSCDRRNRSTIAPQALLLMNNNFVLTEAKYFAERLRREAGDDARAQVERAYRLALGRAPTAFERAKTAEFIRSDPNGLAEFCHALFNLNEFVYRQ
ncbi:MAG TPA: PSD1 and planctomycete cytochrome C domain-containing protein [Blastocatellia bacterium]|nr:PSD1 and planctomycete cytochrome C domain-containing protein [Blastocatellia bacterium]